MKLEHVLLGLLVGLLVVVAVLASTEEPPHSRGLPHPDHGAMALGGESQSRSAQILPWGLAFALLQVALFVGLLLLGLRRAGERVLPRYGLVLLGGGLLALAFCLLFWSYSNFAAAPQDSAVVLGFPTPTAWMLYGVWWSPLFLILLYRHRFDDWVFSEADAAQFDALLVAGRGQLDQASGEDSQAGDESDRDTRET